MARVLNVILFAAMIRPIVAPAAEKPPLDIVIAVQNSRSMRLLDPAYRLSEMLAAFRRGLPKDAAAAVIAYGYRPILLATLLPKEDAFLGSLHSIHYISGGSDLAAAAEVALSEMRDRGRPGSTKVLIIIGDGQNRFRNHDSAERAIWLDHGIAAEAAKRSILVYSIVIGKNADVANAQLLAIQSGGSYARSDVNGVANHLSSFLKDAIAQETHKQLSAAPPFIPRKPDDPAPQTWLVPSLLALSAISVSLLGMVALRSSRAPVSLAADAPVSIPVPEEASPLSGEFKDDLKALSQLITSLAPRIETAESVWKKKSLGAFRSAQAIEDRFTGLCLESIRAIDQLDLMESSASAPQLETIARIRRILISNLGESSVTEIPGVVGAPFDPSKQEQLSSVSGEPPFGTVTKILRRGYTIEIEGKGTSLIRPLGVEVNADHRSSREANA